MKNRLISMILIVIMVLTIIPAIVFANDDPYAEDVFDAVVTTVSTVATTATITETTPATTTISDVNTSTTTVVNTGNATDATNATSQTGSNTSGVASVTGTTGSVVENTNPDPTNPDKTTQKATTTATTTTTAATTHTHVYTGKMTKEPKCTNVGEKTFTCDCGDTYKQEVPMLSHKTEVKVTAATYFKTGAKVKTCMFCGLEISRKVLDKKALEKSYFTLTKGKKSFKINYKKLSKAIGFQVRYRIKGKWKTKTFNTKKAVTKTIKRLSKGTYKVQIRVFRKLSGKKVYSKWTVSRKVKVS